jgi:hypothetical protein
MHGKLGQDSDEITRLTADYLRRNGPQTTMKLMEAMRETGLSASTQRFRRAWAENGYKYGLTMTRPFNGIGRAILWSVNDRWTKGKDFNGKLTPPPAPPAPLPPTQARPGDVQAAVDLIAEAFPGFTVGLLLTPKT